MKTRKNRVEATLSGLTQWYKSSFEHLGWMLLAKQQGNRETIVAYKKSLDRLCDALCDRIDRIHDEDDREDLILMQKNVEFLIKHVKKDFKN
jgi:hypothetical protein